MSGGDHNPGGAQQWRRVNHGNGHGFGRVGIWHAMPRRTNHSLVTAICGASVYSARYNGVEGAALDPPPDGKVCPKCTRLRGEVSS